LLKDFKEFAVKGNVLDMAVGIVIGASFGKIVSSFVADILMPPVGMLAGKLDFSNLFISLNRVPYETLKAAKDAGAPTLNYGLFLNHILDFTIVAFAIFMLVRQVNRWRTPAPVATPAHTKECPHCLSAIHPKATRCPHCTSAVA